MKFTLIAFTLLNAISVRSQPVMESFDSAKWNLVIQVTESLHGISKPGGKRYLFLNIDTRSNKLTSDGMGYLPTLQDTVLTDDRAKDSYIQSKLLNGSSEVKIIHMPEIGKVNRRILFERLFLESIQSDRTSASYLEILQPIDGWDIFEIIENNYWKKLYHKDTSGILHSVLYVPVIYLPNLFENEKRMRYYLYTYEVGISKGTITFKFLTRTVLRIQ